MSKMRFNSGALAPASLALLVVMSGCARPVDVHSPSIRGIGYVRLDDVVKRHPLYPQLAQIDDAIGAVQLQSLGNQVPRTAAQIAAETRRLNAQLQSAQDRANAIIRQKQQDYAAREQSAIRAALGAAAAGNAGADAGREMQNVSAQQAQAVTNEANRNLLAFQQQVIAQDNAAIADIARNLNDRANRAYQQRVVQLQERESQAGLELSQQDASRRLELRTKLSNLALDDATRQQYKDQLAALDRKEAAAVQAQRARDRQELETYRVQLRAQTQRDIAEQTAQIRTQTQAKLQSRRTDVAAHVRSQIGVPQSQPSALTADQRAKIAAIDRQFKTQFQAEAQKTVAGYQSAKSDLDRQYAALQSGTDASTASSSAELQNLHRQRDDLYGKIVDQIRREASQIAGRHGLSVVFSNVAAAPGGLDLTDEVEKDIESLHE